MAWSQGVLWLGFGLKEVAHWACCGRSPSLRPAEVDASGLLPQKSLSEAEILLVLSFTDVLVLVCTAYTLVISPL